MTSGPRNLRRRRRHWQWNMSTKNTTRTTEASAEDRRRVQGIGDNDGGESGLATGPMDWQQKCSVNFPLIFANSNTVLYISCCCLVLILFSSYSFIFCSLQEIISVLQSRKKYVCTKCTLTLLMCPLRTGELKNYDFS